MVHRVVFCRRAERNTQRGLADQCLNGDFTQQQLFLIMPFERRGRDADRHGDYFLLHPVLRKHLHLVALLVGRVVLGVAPAIDIGLVGRITPLAC